MNLDTELRARLRRLADAEQATLDEGASERVLQAVRVSRRSQRVASNLVEPARGKDRGEKRRAHVSLRTVGLLAAAAGITLALSWWVDVFEGSPSGGDAPDGVTARLGGAVSTVIERDAAETRAAAALSTGAASSTNSALRDVRSTAAEGDRGRCAGLAIPEPIEGRVAGADGRLRAVELGRRARWVLSAQSEATIVSLTPCDLIVRLERGRIVMHARELQGGRLQVISDAGSIAVRGTIFELEVSADGLALHVAVAEGAVDVERGGHKATLQRGEQARVNPPVDPGVVSREAANAHTIQRRVLSDEAIAALLEEVARPPLAAQSPLSRDRRQPSQSIENTARPADGAANEGAERRRRVEIGEGAVEVIHSPVDLGSERQRAKTSER